jgi:hypothetical protein
MFLLKASLSDSNYPVSLTTLRTLLVPAGSLKYLTDDFSFIIEINLEAETNSFYIVWSDQMFMNHYDYLNSYGDNNNE